MNGTIHFFAPGLKHYDVEGLNTEGSCGLVAVSVTGAGCALNCKHCGKSILRAMAPTPTPEALLAEAKTSGRKGSSWTARQRRQSVRTVLSPWNLSSPP